MSFDVIANKDAIASCYSYSHSEGLFVGAELEGGIVVTQEDDNAAYYGSTVTPEQILTGAVVPPLNGDLEELYGLLSQIKFSSSFEPFEVAPSRFSMEGHIRSAQEMLAELLNPLIDADRAIPQSLIRSAKAIAFVTQLKAGYFLSGHLGAGIILARTPEGKWSGPCAIATAGVGFGLLIGANKTDAVIIFTDDSAAEVLSGKLQIQFGVDVSMSAGPIGREFSLGVDLGEAGSATSYSYSHSEGLFVGVSIDQGLCFVRSSDNESFYDHWVHPSDIFSGRVYRDCVDLKNLHELLGRAGM